MQRRIPRIHYIDNYVDLLYLMRHHTSNPPYLEIKVPRVIYVLHDGSRFEVETPVGTSVMRAAQADGVRGIEAECGGCLTCATCHVYVDPEWSGRLPEPTDDERIMVDCAIDVRPNSRLSCQIAMTDDLDGLVVEIPASQI